MVNITVELLNELFTIDKSTWRLVRKTKPSNRCRKDGFAGSIGKRGYLVVCIGGGHFYEHRLIYAMSKGVYPELSIDHIDGNKLNNNPKNLRDVSHTVNTQNTLAARKHCISGLRGALFHRQTGKYASCITANKVRHYLGLFETAEEAHGAYMKAKDQLHAMGAQRGVQFSPTSTGRGPDEE